MEHEIKVGDRVQWNSIDEYERTIVKVGIVAELWPEANLAEVVLDTESAPHMGRITSAYISGLIRVDEPTTPSVDQHDDLIALHPNPFPIICTDYELMLGYGDLGGVELL